MPWREAMRLRRRMLQGALGPRQGCRSGRPEPLTEDQVESSQCPPPQCKIRVTPLELKQRDGSPTAAFVSSTS